MRISVLLPVYNTPGQFLAESVRSCFQQLLPPDEVLIVDDGSTEPETLACLAELRSIARIRVHRLTSNSGVSAALNTGLEHATGDWIARMDADDVMLPHRLAAQAEFLRRSPETDVLGGQLVFFGVETGSFTTHPAEVTREIAQAHPTGWFLNHPTVMARKDAVLAAGGYDSRFNGCEDMELWYRMLGRGMKLCNLNSIVLLYRLHTAQATARKREVPLASFKGYLAPGAGA